jgi:hypothetical protein
MRLPSGENTALPVCPRAISRKFAPSIPITYTFSSMRSPSGAPGSGIASRTSNTTCEPSGLNAPPPTRQRAPLGCKPPRTNHDRSRPFARATLIQPPSLPPTTTIRRPSAE